MAPLHAARGRAGWAPNVADGDFSHEFSGPSAGPPWYVDKLHADNTSAADSRNLGPRSGGQII